MTNEERPREVSAAKVERYLSRHPHAYKIRTHNGTVDFTIGDPDLWPRYGRDGHLRIIRSSSISFDSILPEEDGMAVQGNPQTGSNIHLPPAAADLWDELEAASEFAEKFKLVNGSFRLGGLLPPPDGVTTPHLILVENATVAEVTDALDEAFRLYEEVYAAGDRVIQRKPEGDHAAE